MNLAPSVNVAFFIQTLKQLARRDSLIALLVILVGFGSFGLGRLSVLDSQKTPIAVSIPKNAPQSGQNSNEEFKASAQVLRSVNNAEGILVGSKNSRVYHFPWCSGAKRISAENKIIFASKAEAEKAGYRPASTCKGLQ